MRTRLGFSTALQVDPENKLRQALREKIRLKKTVVLVPHEQAAIPELCDGLLWIEQGREQDMGPVEDVIPAYLKAMTLKP